jgi:hypothetical protein
MVPALSPIASTAMSKACLRSSTDIEKNSPCFPAINSPSIPRSSTQCCIFLRNPSSSIVRSSLNGVKAAAQIPRMYLRVYSLASDLVKFIYFRPDIFARHRHLQVVNSIWRKAIEHWAMSR